MNEKRRSSDPILETLVEDMKIIKTALIGNIKEEKDGLIAEVHAQKKDIVGIKWLIGIVFVAVIGFCGKIIYSSIV